MSDPAHQGTAQTPTAIQSSRAICICGFQCLEIKFCLVLGRSPVDSCAATSVSRSKESHTVTVSVRFSSTVTRSETVAANLRAHSSFNLFKRNTLEWPMERRGALKRTRIVATTSLCVHAYINTYILMCVCVHARMHACIQRHVNMHVRAEVY